MVSIPTLALFLMLLSDQGEQALPGHSLKDFEGEWERVVSPAQKSRNLPCRWIVQVGEKTLKLKIYLVDGKLFQNSEYRLDGKFSPGQLGPRPTPGFPLFQKMIWSKGTLVLLDTFNPEAIPWKGFKEEWRLSEDGNTIRVSQGVRLDGLAKDEERVLVRVGTK